MKKNTKQKNKKRFEIKPVLLLSIIIIIFVFGYSFAKYVIQEESIHIQSAKDFYFNSDILNENNTQYILSDWNGVDKYNITINLKNYEDILRITNDNIECNLVTSCENNNITVTTSQNTENLTLLGGQKSEQEIVLNIEPKINFGKGEFILINVTAQATKPYEKTISANFKIYVEEIINYETNLVESSNSEYVNLYIETYNENIEPTIKYDNTKVILDTNNDLLEQVEIVQSGTTNSFNTTLEKNSNYNITFIKKDVNDEIILGTDIIIN